MKRQLPIYLLTAVLLLIGGFDTSWGYAAEREWYYHFTFHFAHASVWHLAGNLLCFYILTRYRASWAELITAYLVASLCSFISPHTLPTVGLSGLIYALLGLRLAMSKRLSQRSVIRMLLVILLPCLTGKVNVLLHLSSLGAGYLLYHTYNNLMQISRYAKRYYR